LNILTDELPVTVAIGTTEYKVNYDFRVCLKIIMAFEDNELTPQEKQIILLSSLYPKLPPDTEQALERAHWFLNGGVTGTNESDGLRLYSIAKDANFIFAAFKQTHGIDLQDTDLHWWKFLALFMDLGQDTTFCQLISLRKRLAKGTASKEEQQAADEMGELINVPQIDDRTLEEKEQEAEFMRLVEMASKK